MIKILLSGANGKMGKVIAQIVKNKENMKIVAGFDVVTDAYDDFPIYSTPSEFEGEADAIIDFSHPSALLPLLKFAENRQIPAVIATTGLTQEQKNTLFETSKRVPVFFSANMSLGVNLLADLVKRAAKVLYENFDIEIIEKHHNQKLDAPSGTALYIADETNIFLPQPYHYEYDRHSVRKKRDKKEIGIHAVRGGTIVGEHDVLFAGRDEMIEIRHSAASKEIFAIGAVSAAQFMVGKPAGLYDMNALLSEIE